MHKHLILIGFPVKVSLLDGCGREFGTRHLLVHHVVVSRAIRGVNIEHQTVGIGVRGDVIDIALSAQTSVTKTDATLVSASGAIHRQTTGVMHKTQREVRLDLQRFRNIRENATGNQRTAELHRIDHKVVQIDDSELVHSIIELVSVVHTAQNIRLVVENLTPFARLENRVVRIVGHAAFVARHVDV